MLAKFQDAGGTVFWEKYDDEGACGVFTHPKGGSVRVDWDAARARKAGVLGNGTWSKYARSMYRARCISEGVRTVYPACLFGYYTPEEVEEFEPNKEPIKNTMKDITPKTPMIEVIEDTAHKEKADEIIKNLKNH
jgi:hypothetical protein